MEVHVNKETFSILSVLFILSLIYHFDRDDDIQDPFAYCERENIDMTPASCRAHIAFAMSAGM